MDFGITDAQYREQVLALTPLGSSHEQVKAFVRGERQFGKEKPNPEKEAYDLGLHGLLPYLQRSSGGFNQRLLREEPPHIPMNPHDLFPAQKGRRYLEPTFYRRPVFWRRELYLLIIYIFDDQNKVIDLFTHGEEVRPQAW